MEPISSSETSVETKRTARRHIPEDDTLQNFSYLFYFCPLKTVLNIHFYVFTFCFPWLITLYLMLPSLKNTLFWNVTTCRLIDVYRRFGGTYCLHRQVWRMSHSSFLKREAVHYFEKSANFYENTQRHIAQGTVCHTRSHRFEYLKFHTKLNSVALVLEQTIPTERPPLVGEVTANFCGKRLSRGQRNGFPRWLISVF
jgi:hypothetical protein